MLQTSAFKLASRFIGLKEVSGISANSQIVSFLQLEDPSIVSDEVAWCSAFVNYIAWLLELPRSKSLAARSWLKIGSSITLEEAEKDCDVVVLMRGGGSQPGPDVINALGHVGFFAGLSFDKKSVVVLGGNQGDQVCIESFPVERVLGVRRLIT